MLDQGDDLSSMVVNIKPKREKHARRNKDKRVKMKKKKGTRKMKHILRENTGQVSILIIKKKE